MIVIDVLCPERNDSPTVEVEKPRADRQERSTDRTRVTRLQVINIKGELVDVEQ